MLAPKKANDYKISNNKDKGKENDTEKYTGLPQTWDYVQSSTTGSTMMKIAKDFKLALQISTQITQHELLIDSLYHNSLSWN